MATGNDNEAKEIVELQENNIKNNNDKSNKIKSNALEEDAAKKKQTINNQAGNNQVSNNQVSNNQASNNQASNNQASNNQAGNNQKTIVSESSVAVESKAISNWIWKNFSQANNDKPKMAFIADCNKFLGDADKITVIETKKLEEKKALASAIGELIIKTADKEHPISIGKNSIEVIGKENMVPAVFVVMAMAARKQIEDAIASAKADRDEAQLKLAESKKLVTISSSGTTDAELMLAGEAIVGQGLIPKFPQNADDAKREAFINKFLTKLSPEKIEALNQNILALDTVKEGVSSFPDAILKKAVTEHIQANKNKIDQISKQVDTLEQIQSLDSCKMGEMLGVSGALTSSGLTALAANKDVNDINTDAVFIFPGNETHLKNKDESYAEHFIKRKSGGGLAAVADGLHEKMGTLGLPTMINSTNNNGEDLLKESLPSLCSLYYAVGNNKLVLVPTRPQTLFEQAFSELKSVDVSNNTAELNQEPSFLGGVAKNPNTHQKACCESYMKHMELIVKISKQWNENKTSKSDLLEKLVTGAENIGPKGVGIQVKNAFLEGLHKQSEQVLKQQSNRSRTKTN